jgi:hypothetical protein
MVNIIHYVNPPGIRPGHSRIRRRRPTTAGESNGTGSVRSASFQAPHELVDLALWEASVGDPPYFPHIAGVISG